MLQNLKTNLSQCPTEPVDAEPGPPPPVCDGEKMIYFLKTSGAKTILLAYILYKHTSIILSFKETNRPAPMASVALKSDKSATSFPIVATRPTRRVVQQISSLTSAPRCFGCFQLSLDQCLNLSFTELLMIMLLLILVQRLPDWILEELLRCSKFSKLHQFYPSLSKEQFDLCSYIFFIFCP